VNRQRRPRRKQTRTRRPETKHKPETTTTIPAAAAPLMKDHTLQPQDIKWRLK